MLRIVDRNNPYRPAMTATLLLVVALAGCRRTLGRITVAEGDMEIRAVTLSDRIPTGCSGTIDSGCNVAKEGFEILKVSIAPPKNVALEGFWTAKDSFKATVVVSDGSTHKVLSEGSSASNDEYYIAFAVPVSSTSYELRWPGNPSIQLNPK